MQAFAKSHAYAQAATGYTGSLEQYARLQYQAYATICQRCDVAPMPLAKWLVCQSPADQG